MDATHYCESCVENTRESTLHQSVVVRLLPGLSIDQTRLSDVLVRLALLEDDQSSRAIYHSIIALVACHRGDSRAALQDSKRAVLQALQSDAQSKLFQGLQHVAANLLLTVLGLQQTFDDQECSSEWVGHSIGSKKTSDAVSKGALSVGSDESILLGWVYYLEVMARFTFRHWRTTNITAQFILALGTFIQSVPGISAHAHPVIQALAETSAISMHSTHSDYTVTDNQQLLGDLRAKLDSVTTDPSGLDACPNEVLHHEEAPLPLDRLAGRIYLERVSNAFSGRSTKIDTWTRAAILTIAQLDTCLAPFALFITCCELQDDEDRIVILRLLAKMEQRPHLGSLMEAKSLIQTAWNLQDFAEPGGA